METERILNPKESLSDIDKMYLVDELTLIAREGFGSRIERDDVKNHVLNCNELYLIRNLDIFGFASFDSFDFKDKSCLYLHGIVLKKEAQGCGFFEETNNLAISYGNYDYLCMRTQNPIVYAATNKIVKNIYPNDSIPENIKELGEFVARDFLKMNKYDKDTMIGKETYGHSLYGNIPFHKDASKVFEKLGIDYNMGDSVIIIGDLNGSL